MDELNKLQDEFRQSLEDCREDILFFRERYNIHRGNLAIRKQILDIIEELAEKEVEWLRAIRHLENIGKKLSEYIPSGETEESQSFPQD